MKLTTTFNLLRKAGACESGYKKLAKSLGCVSKYGDDKPINLLRILESNGVQDMLWCLRATEQPEGKRIASQLAIELAADALPIFEAKYPNDARPRAAIQGARDYLDGKISRDDLIVLRRASYAAAAAAAYAAAYAADAADAAAYAAAYADAYADAADAAADAADAAAYAAAAAADSARQKARSRQAAIIRSILSD